MSVFFVAYLVLLLPTMAIRSAQILRDSREGKPGAPPLPSRRSMLSSTVVMLVLLGALTWLTARQVPYDIFALGDISVWDVLAGVAALAIQLGLRAIAVRIHTEEELRSSILVHWAPRDAGDWTLAIACGILAGVVEEAAYRGVGVAILTPVFGAPMPAIVLLTAAFAAGHAVQGKKSVMIVVAMGLLMQGLVAVTGTLVIAMIAHATYDVIAIKLLTRDAAKLTAELKIAIFNSAVCPR